MNKFNNILKILAGLLILLSCTSFISSQLPAQWGKKNHARIQLTFTGFEDDYLGFGLSYRYYLRDHFNIGWKITASNFKIPEKGYLGKAVTIGPIWGYDYRLDGRSFGLRTNLFLWATVFSDQKKREGLPELGDAKVHLSSKFSYGSDLDITFYKSLRIGRKLYLQPGLGWFAQVSIFSWDELLTGAKISRTEELYYELGLIVSLPIHLLLGKEDSFVIKPQYYFSLYSNLLFPNTLADTFQIKFQLKI